MSAQMTATEYQARESEADFTAWVIDRAHSWRDDFWGIGPNGLGHNKLGKLWMELRDEFVAALRLAKGEAS